MRRRPIHQLSKGYRQRVGLAAALLHSPPVLILDEPTAGLDPTQIQEVRGLIGELAGEHTILLSTHILPEVELTCNRIIVMAGGHICGSGTMEELRSKIADGTTYVVETDLTSARSVVSAIKNVVDVKELPLEAGWRQLTVRGRDKTIDLRETIVGTIVGLGGVVREIRRERPSIEHLFFKMIGHADAALKAVTSRGTSG